jgi:MoaA/NifB/PqqE/SkfB family radical SAM enzyme
MKDEYEIDGHKLDYHVDRVAEWMSGDTTPVYVEVSPTARCNHSCKFCALDYANHKNVEIPTDRLITLGQEMGEIGVRGVMFGGEGEPTLHTGLAEVCREYTSQHHPIACALTTNGAGLGRNFAASGGDRLTWVKVSMNGGDAEAYAKVHDVPSHTFERTWTRLLEFRDHAPNTTIGVQCVVTEDNLDSLDTLAWRVAKEGLAYLVLKPLNPQSYSGNIANQQPVRIPDDIVNLVKDWNNEKTKIIIRDSAFESLHSCQSYPRCLSVPYFWAYISSDQRLVACSNHLPDPRFTIGVLSKESFRELWYSHKESKREDIKAMMRNFDITQCRKACRMDRINEWLWKIRHPNPHFAFI